MAVRSIPPSAFDASWYMAQNPDLGAAAGYESIGGFGIDTPEEAYQHYLKYGMKEGRQPSAYAAQTDIGVNAPGVSPLNVASFTEPQKQALYEMTQAPTPIDPRISQVLDEARSSIGGMTTPYDPNSYQQFMNPYLQEVVDATRNDITQSYNDSRQRAREELAAAGAFGSSAMGRAYGDIEEVQNRQLGSQLGGLRAQGFDTAQGNALNLYGMNRANQAAQASQLMNLGGAYSGLDQYGRNVAQQALGNKLGAGNQIQAQNQATLDAYFGDVNRQLQYPYQQTGFLQNTLGAYPTGQTQTSTQPGVGMIQGAIGGGLLGSSFSNYMGRESARPTSSFIGPMPSNSFNFLNMF